jgi:hypothetical protein
MGRTVHIKWCSIDGGTRDDCKLMRYGPRNANLPEYGQSLVMMLTSRKGISAVKYGLVPGGIGGRSEATTISSPGAMSSFSAVTIGGDRRDGSLERVSALPH